MGRARFGGGCVNDVVVHLATSSMGFGGVGESGMGAYHGKTGFEGPSPTKNPSWTKNAGWTCPCATSPITASLTGGCCACF